MMNNYINLAQKIVNTNDQVAYRQMVNAICQPTTIQLILNHIHESDLLHFTFTEILTKSILNGQFCPINETKSDDNSMKENINQKAKIYSVIISKIFQSINFMNFDKKQYILRSALNSISVCLKDLSDNNRNLQLFNNILEMTLFPSFKINQLFVSSIQNQIIILQPSQQVRNYFLQNPKNLSIYRHSIKILIQLIQYVTMSTVYNSYYDYRRNIYTFRNTYLASILNVSIQYHKILHLQWKKSTQNLQIFQALILSYNLLEKLMTYPFTLTLHQFQSDQDVKDNVVGFSSEIYFPSYFRNLLLDRDFIDGILEFFMFLLGNLVDINQLRETVLSLVRSLGRIISASIYTFNNEPERKIFRAYCSSLTLSLIYNFKFFDSFYIDVLCDIFTKVLSSYSNDDLQNKKDKIIQGILYFSKTIIQKCLIKLQDGKRNPFNKAFSLLVQCLGQSKQMTIKQSIQITCQEILNCAFLKLYDWQTAEKIISQYGKNKKNQIECFEELFQNLPIVFSHNLQKNLQKIKSLQIEKFSQAQQSIWLHLCSILLPNHNSTRQQTQIVLKYFKLAKNGQTIASLNYIKTLVGQVLYDMDNGAPNNTLWSWIHQIQHVSFSQFMLFVIRVCKKNFQNQNTDIIDYSLDVFKDIYTRLRKSSNNSQKFQEFYQEVKVLINSLNSTVFQNPKFFKRRVQLFAVISSIWITNENFKYLTQIYNLISQNIKTNINALNFLKYMHDIRGILQPIDSPQSFQIIVSLALEDLNIFLPIILSKQNIQNLFSDQYFLKVFCKMVLQFVTDYCRRLTYNVQTVLPFQIYDIFKPYLLQATKYNFPKSLVTVWQKFVALNPIQDMLPLSPEMKEKQSKDFQSLIREYFQNIHRVPLQMFESLYPYIEDRIQYLVYWWQEIVRRKLYPKISLKNVVDSRIATTKRQKQQLAKLVYYVGTYSQNYWNVSGFADQREFINWFMQNYKDFKDY